MKNRQMEEAKATFKMAMVHDYHHDQRQKRQKAMADMLPDSPNSLTKKLAMKRRMLHQDTMLETVHEDPHPSTSMIMSTRATSNLEMCAMSTEAGSVEAQSTRRF